MTAFAEIIDSPTACTFRIASVDVEVSGPRAILGLLRQTLLEGADASGPANLRGRVELRFDQDVWTISGSTSRSNKTLSQLSLLPEVCGAAISSILAEVAHHADLHIWRACVVEREGDALALDGDDWESCLVLAAHLHTRGWSYVSADYALVRLNERRAFGFRKLLYVNSSMLQSLPTVYRRAVEASPWYVTRRDIAFHAVDPGVAWKAPWAGGGALRAIVRVDGDTAERPALERTQHFEVTRGVHGEYLQQHGVTLAELKLAGAIQTCDLLERWFGGACVTST